MGPKLREKVQRDVLAYLQTNGPPTAAQVFDALRDGPYNNSLMSTNIPRILLTLEGKGLVVSEKISWDTKIWRAVE